MSKDADARAKTRAQVLNMVDGGVTPEAVAQQLGLSVHQVFGYIGARRARKSAVDQAKSDATAPKGQESVPEMLLRVANVPAVMDLREAMIFKALRIVTVADETNPEAARVQFSLAWECIDMAEGILRRLIDYAKAGELGNV